MPTLRIRVLRKTFASVKEEAIEVGGNCIMKSSKSVFYTK
jgi:hypothetical protein